MTLKYCINYDELGERVELKLFSNKVPRWLKSTVFIFRCLSLSFRNMT